VIQPLAATDASTSAEVSPLPSNANADEAGAYGRAHRAHFVENAPARALAAWNVYLAAFPHGSFAPEASYNRAICLVRLGRDAEAARALRPFASGRARGYRREEARQLLYWLGEAVP
jgi:TolA-binding protein